MFELWAVILAAGESKRMGVPKMLLDFNGITMIEKVISNVTGSVIDKTMVVLGAEKEKIVGLIGQLPVRYCYNENYKEGMLSSVKCGLRNLPPRCDCVMIFQGDQPLITSAVINKIIEAHRGSDKGIVIPVYNNKRGHPLLIDKKYITEVEKLDPEYGLRSLSQKYHDDVLEVSINDSGILKDFDTYYDYINEINQLQ